MTAGYIEFVLVGLTLLFLAGAWERIAARRAIPLRVMRRFPSGAAHRSNPERR